MLQLGYSRNSYPGINQSLGLATLVCVPESSDTGTAPIYSSPVAWCAPWTSGNYQAKLAPKSN
ncbi:hypothetical protein CROQUDRAFT_100460 [Cronartium quercuum f. sp. fusiforme G11]|uniref:Uncharacterized protein n=1 Tax=Cronartium quercuum f. sp. fusiforme G11 TaxID=708437 RepID=A0A9P6T640_9BASI|nr:hypothetical protein CROQUDRAFT_100460 [Cronartium quercuum f. sp. fusiforme G11]